MNGLFTFRDRAVTAAMLRTGLLSGLISIAGEVLAAEDIQFNTDILDLNDRSNIDLSQFSRSGFILPGNYLMRVQINTHSLPEQRVAFYPPDDDPKGSQACVSADLVEQLGLKKNQMSELTWWKGGECLDSSSLSGMEINGDLSTSTLNISIPHAYLEYSAQDWDPPSRWDEGVPGVLFDYNLTGQSVNQRKTASRNNLSGNGTLGANAGPWRLRANWQGRVDNERNGHEQGLEWNRFYAYRALPSIHSNLMLGESYLHSDMFDSFGFTGFALSSDDNQLPPNLRGYAPEVVGVAKSNAKVTISQQGLVLYETLVAAGPFRIQDLNNAISGSLDVRVEEQDGSVNSFKVESSSIPYLTRPGTVRYKLAAGRPSMHGSGQGRAFGSGEFSWGVNTGWSLYGGGISDSNYTALSLGVGRDLLAFGALSFDASRARTTLQGDTLSGASYRLSYSKRFEEYDSQVSFAGYRFSEKNYVSVSEYLNALEYGRPEGSSKSLYTATFNKHFRDAGVSTYLTFTDQSFWNRPSSQRWNLSLARSFNMGSVQNVNLSFNLFRNQERNQQTGIKSDNTGMYLSLTMPFGKSGHLSGSANSSHNKNSYSARFSDQLSERSQYQLTAGNNSVGGYLSHTADHADVSLSASLQENRHTSLGMSARGGATVTPYGGALHRSGGAGGTRLMVDTSGVSGVPVRGYGRATTRNFFGKAVVPDVNGYVRTVASVDLENLPANVEATRSVTQLTLTEGAIGYRTLDLVAGHKAMAVLHLSDGTVPPFGGTVKNEKQQETGIINDGGSVYLSGIRPGEKMVVSWGGVERCTLVMPANLPADGLATTLDLPCQMVMPDNATPASASQIQLTDTEITPS